MTHTAWKTISIRKNPAGPAPQLRPLPAILLIDDHVETVRILRSLLESHGYKVWTASDGLQGFALACETEPDVIFTDIRMPGLNGFELISKLRESESTRHIPVVLHSGSVNEKEKQHGLDLGAAAFLSKPCSVAEIRQTIAGFMQAAQVQPQSLELRDLLLSA
jgi:CheY-like chemotaxis protein